MNEKAQKIVAMHPVILGHALPWHPAIGRWLGLRTLEGWQIYGMYHWHNN